MAADGRFLYCCNQRADSVTAFRADAKRGSLVFTGHYAPVGNPPRIVVVDFARAGEHHPARGIS